MRVHLVRDLEHLQKDILAMGAMVEAAVTGAINALVNRDPGLGEEVLLGDNEINTKEVEVEEQCLKILALHQPVASDLRYIITVLKVNNDLERMGDVAGHIANRAVYLSSQPPIGVPSQLDNMADIVKGMVRMSLDALIRQDASLAQQIIETDDQVDEIHWVIYRDLLDRMRNERGIIDRAFFTISAIRHLERIGDYATNIAEDVYFLVTGKIIRHLDENKLIGHGDN